MDSPRFFQKSSAVWISSGLSSTHWPRTRTSGALSFASAFSSASVSRVSPSATAQSTSTIESSESMPLARSFGDLTDADAVSRSFVPLRVHHAGSSTP